LSSPAKPLENAAVPRASKIGVMLINLGTPEGTDKASMRRYLKEFLSDRRVIEWPRAVWYPVLYGIVLNTRPKKSGALYDQIWNAERNESPLLTFTRAQSEKLAEALKGDEQIVVDYAMRYGNPSIEGVTGRMMAAGCDRIVMLPLYPQYSAATTATVNDKFFETLIKLRFQPAIRTVPAYHDDPAYIDALACSIEKHMATLDFEPEVVIASYHGIPQSYARRGDPYPEQCLETSRLLRERLGWDEKKLMSCFQSRFGPEEWLQPYTDKTVEKLAKEGVKSIAVFNPGFVADCLETLQEIAIEAAHIFRHAGGENFSHIPCLNDSDEGMAVIETLVKRELAGWA
jgi:ferrochelatase